jgi:hypothetical protein
MNDKLVEVREQIQEDIMTLCDGMDDSFVTALCQIVCDNFRKLKEQNSNI